jgi:hypothetical protein
MASFTTHIATLGGEVHRFIDDTKRQPTADQF